LFQKFFEGFVESAYVSSVRGALEAREMPAEIRSDTITTREATRMKRFVRKVFCIFSSTFVMKKRILLLSTSQ
jgi:hypothetical protein